MDPNDIYTGSTNGPTMDQLSHKWDCSKMEYEENVLLI